MPKPRLGLCCTFCDEPIRFRTTTVTAVKRLERSAALAKLAELCQANAEALLAAVNFCAAEGIGCFRVNSQILPIKTHAECGYRIEELPGWRNIVDGFQHCGEVAHTKNVRLTFHPDQFVVLNSPREEVVASSLAELEYQAEVAEWIGADVINIHGGGAFGDKASALERFARTLGRLSERVRRRLTVENDDRIYSPEELLPLCRIEGVPLVYDVHHHRCHRDRLSIKAATDAAIGTWDREPLFHISSPLEGWDGPKPERHHDYIDPGDFPSQWRRLAITVEVEAKAKERAVRQLAADLRRR